MTTLTKTTSSQPSYCLLVEDDDTHAELFVRSARAFLNWRISRAQSLRETYQILQASLPEIVILDLGLPESDGLDTLARFLSNYPNVPVIVLTAISDVDLGEEALQMGAMDFISKDEIDAKSLARSIRYSLQHWSQKQQLVSSLADLEYFGNTVAHDLISPLNAIQGFAHLVELGLKGSEVGEDVTECLELLKTTTNQAARLVTDLHTLAKLGKSGVQRTEIDLASMVSETETSLRTLIDSTGGTILVYPVPNLFADRGLLAHILQNLIGNALKYTRPGIPPVIGIDSFTRNGNTVVRIRDNGVGIDAKDGQRIFLPFERLNGHEDKAGSGLGLSICKRIVIAHGGEIWTEPLDGPGACFSFHLGN